VKVPKKSKASEETAAEVQMRLAVAIKERRVRMGVTQEELAWRADMHRTYLADIERGSRNVTLRSIANLARALQLPVGTLLGHYDGALVGPPLMGEVLLVEDSRADADRVLRTFKQARFSNPLKWVTTGREALDYLSCKGRYAGRHPVVPQLVLLDLDLPDGAGPMVLRSIKARAETRAIPVVVMTRACDNRRVAEYGRLGAADCLPTPLDFSNFSQVTPKLNLHWALVSPSHRPAQRSRSPAPSRVRARSRAT
jgi:CheY-like chemotaxis protein/DNA-binding XRE family transcriptional regulator